VEHEPGLIEFFASAEGLPVCRNEFGHEIQAKDVRGLGLEGGIGDGALAVADLRNHGTRAEQMDSSAGAHSGTAQKASIILRGPSAYSSVNHHCVENGE